MIYNNLKPPALLFTNDGVYSPTTHVDVYGVPSGTSLQYSAEPQFWGNATYNYFEPPQEKLHLYGTHIEEVFKWYSDLYERHQLTPETCGELEAFVLPNGELLPNDPQENGKQYDGYTLHNPDFWRHVLRNCYRCRGYGVGNTLDQFALDQIDYEIEYGFGDSYESRYFDYGKVGTTPIWYWLFPWRTAFNFHWHKQNFETPISNITICEIQWNATTNNKSIRQQYGMYGDGRNAAIAMELNYNHDVGILWGNFPYYSTPNIVDTTWFHSGSSGLNVMEFSDEVLDELPPTVDDAPYLVIQNTDGGAAVLPSGANFGEADTGYPHNYKVHQISSTTLLPEYARLCSDDLFVG